MVPGGDDSPISHAGGWCWNKAICDARVSAEVNSVTSQYWGDTETFELGSILNAGSDTRFGEANVIYARYCSSDAWIGNRPADVAFNSTSTTDNNIHFRGRAIVKAVLQDLQAVHGMSTVTPQKVVLAGSSAGSRGVLHNLNHMKTDFASYGWNQVSTYGIIDSGLYLIQPTVDWTKSDLDVQARGVVSYNYADVDPICKSEMAAQYPNNAQGAEVSSQDATGQAWRCLMAQFAVKTLRSPYVLHQFQMDAWGTYVQLPIPYGWATKEIMNMRPSWKTTMQTYRDIVRSIMFEQPTATQIANGGTRATHSSACYQHMNLRTSFMKDKYRITMSDGSKVSLGNVIDSFIFEAPGPTDAVENCTGWECGEDCDYTRFGRSSTDVCGWWYWFSALREMTPQCQNSLVDYHVSGYFEWPLDEACPCLNALPWATVNNNDCPHLFAYGYSPGIPAPAYPRLFPYRPTQQNYGPTNKPKTIADLALECRTSYIPYSGNQLANAGSTCSALKTAFQDAQCCNQNLSAVTGYSVVSTTPPS